MVRMVIETPSCSLWRHCNANFNDGISKPSWHPHRFDYFPIPSIQSKSVGYRGFWYRRASIAPFNTPSRLHPWRLLNLHSLSAYFICESHIQYATLIWSKQLHCLPLEDDIMLTLSISWRWIIFIDIVLTKFCQDILVSTSDGWIELTRAWIYMNTTWVS